MRSSVSTRELVRDNEYAAEVKRHFNWVNWIFSVSLFAITLGALQFAQPWKMCAVGLLLVVPMYWHAFTSFPPTLATLRQLSKEDPDNIDLKGLVRHLEKKFHGWKAVFTVSPLWLSLAFYIVVFFSGQNKWLWPVTFVSWLKI